MEKTVTARKEHICDVCGQIIKKGEDHKYGEWRVPRFDDDQNQVGVEFVRSRVHCRCFLNDVQFDCDKIALIDFG